MAFNPTKCRLQICLINGVDVRKLTNCIAVYESMCKPYITATITLIDNVNMVNGMRLKGGEPVSFMFDGGENTYEQDMYILTIDGEESTDNLRSIIYSITCASLSYFNDKANLVQKASTLIPATAMAAQIHNEYVGGDYPLKVKMPSSGMIALPEGGGYQVNNKKPFKAIKDLLQENTYGGIGTVTGMYFRDATSYVMSPLEHLFNTMGSQATFKQNNAAGSDWRNTFETTHIIISAMTKKDENANSSRGGGGGLAAGAKTATQVFDIAQGKEALSGIGKMAGGLGGVGRFATGKWGGKQASLEHDTRRSPLATFAGMQSAAVNAFQAKVKDGVNYLIKVPIQGGINCTVGQGITAILVAPQGDQKRAGAQSVGGQMLVADLSHECYFDSRTVQGTTTFRAVQLSGQGGDNAVA